ncbi:hypothetical protein [Selenomonas sp. F0473]|uniref:hypothetical protein n=1 Tax=Selenomonas sp. F0473 TaxID=999423 RepID=UPI0002FE0F38|nr:hypothetical protein [Selenomonas sp. F0473]
MIGIVYLFSLNAEKHLRSFSASLRHFFQFPKFLPLDLSISFYKKDAAQFCAASFARSNR